MPGRVSIAARHPLLDLPKGPTLLRFTIRRLLSGVILLFVISSVAFLLLNLGAGDVGRRILGPQATADTVALKNEQLGVDQPVLTRYIDWLTSALRGDFGTSWFTSQPVEQ